nr:NUDIX-like domain-containing protein [Marinicella sp. W31]MDC2878686.1 NUDIX-like domain-containing protein [Marinicella sp. W31]
MTSIFDKAGPHDDPSALTAFAGCRIIRDSEHRADDALITAARTPGARFIAFAGGRPLVKHERQVLDPYFARYEILELSPDRESAVLLGHDANGMPLLSIELGVDPEALPAHLKVTSTRAVYSEGLFDEETQGALALATSLNAWGRNHRFCGCCGQRPKAPPVAFAGSAPPAAT